MFKLGADAAAAGVRAIAIRQPRAAAERLGVGTDSISTAASSRSTRRVGKGRVLLFGPEILQRAQPHGTFKLLFNGIFASVAR